MHKRILALTVLMLFLAVNAFAASKNKGPKAWKIKDIAEAPAEKVELRDDRNKLLKTVDIDQMILIYSIMVALEEIAEINADLYILEGKAPNAFAGKGQNDENIVGINFAMLDLIGNDIDGFAAILGHELAHLKLGHGEEKEEAQKRNANTTFITAAATKYSRDNERESDYLGVIWAIEAGYDPKGAVRVHEKLYKLSKTSRGAFVGSHPSSIERITILKSLVRRLSIN